MKIQERRILCHIRVIIATILAVIFAFYLPEKIGVSAKWGAVGLSVSGGLAGWIEYAF